MAAALAAWTGLYIGSVLGAPSSAVRTRPVAFDGDVFLYSRSYLFQCQADSCTDVPAFVNPGLGPSGRRTGGTEASESAEVAESSETTAEQVPEEVFEITETSAEIRTAAGIYSLESTCAFA